MRSVVRLAWLLLVVGQIVGCGGGGGGGSSPPPPPPGSFTLSGNSAAFAVLQLDATPAEADLTLTLTSSGAAFVGAAYVAPATQPSWLGISITGSGNNYVVHLSIQTTNIAAGAYSSTFSVGTADANGKILMSQTITVNYTVTGRISIQTAPYQTTFTYGASQSTGAAVVAPVAVTGNGRTWAAVSDSPWLQVSSANFTGDATLAVGIDPSALLLGTYTGHVTITDAALATNTVTESFTITVVAPLLTFNAGPVLLGGADGLSAAPAFLAASLNTDQASYPYTVSLSTVDGNGWLHVDAATGTVSSTPVPLSFSGDHSQLVGGTYTGQITLTVTVKTLTLTEVRPVTSNVEANRIVVAAAGVGFVSMPSGSVLTRTVRVYNTLGRSDVPWAATSDSPWLSVTASGVTGGDITLTANPTGLPADTTQFATVTVTSTDASIENQETIRVGLNVRSTVANATKVAASGRYITTSPVEPIAFVTDNANQIVAYDVRDGTVKRTFAGVVATAGALVTSGDGSRLYVSDLTNRQVVELDAVSGAVLHTYSATPPLGQPYGLALAFIRSAGYSLLVTPSGRIYDVTTGAFYDNASFTGAPYAFSFAVSPDQSLLAPDFGTLYRVKRSSLNGGGVSAAFFADAPTEAGAQGQACIARDGDRVYSASGGVYNFPGYSLSAAAVVQVLPGSFYPNAILCLWNGIVIGGTSQSPAPVDVWVYDGPSGTQLGLLSSAQETNILGLVPRGMAVSADGGSLVTLTLSNPGADLAAEIYFQPLPAPL